MRAMPEVGSSLAADDAPPQTTYRVWVAATYSMRAQPASDGMSIIPLTRSVVVSISTTRPMPVAL